MTRRTAIITGIVLVFVVALGSPLLIPDVRQYVTFQLQDHTGAPPPGEPVQAPGSDAPPIRLAVAGDVGTGGEAEYATADAMNRLEGSSEYDALLLLGDNVYDDGDPTQVDRTVFEPFADVLDAPTQLLAVLGNHDVEDGHGDAQAEALAMPSRWYSTTVGNTLIVALDSTQPDDPDQRAWLEETLAASDATWKIAILHHPPYSGGYHGSSVDVRDAFAPLFEEYGVQLVLAGHDHDYQLSTAINGVTYIVSGAAAKIRDTHLADFSAAAWSTYHFLDIGIWPDRLVVRAIDHDDRVFDEITLTTAG